MNDLDLLVQSAETEFSAAATPAYLENAKARFLGKTGRVTELLKGMAALAVEEKKTRGAEINVVKQRIPAARAGRAACIPCRARWNASSRSSARWASTWPTAPRSKRTGTTSPR